jgi:hypothetical protein
VFDALPKDVEGEEGVSDCAPNREDLDHHARQHVTCEFQQGVTQ